MVIKVIICLPSLFFHFIISILLRVTMTESKIHAVGNLTFRDKLNESFECHLFRLKNKSLFLALVNKVDSNQ